MKTATIDTAALWAGTISTFQDGDIFRETNIDTMVDSIGDRLGYLKAKADAAAYVAADNTFTGNNTFTTASGGDDLTVGGDGELIVNVGATMNGAMAIASAAFTGRIEIDAEFNPGSNVLADAAATCSAVLFQRVPTLTANRVYTLPAGSDGDLAVLTRSGTEAFTATLQDPTGSTTVGVISSGASGWIAAQKRGSNWVAVMWGGTVASIRTTV
jgi:hypothetical protein